MSPGPASMAESAAILMRSLLLRAAAIVMCGLAAFAATIPAQAKESAKPYAGVLAADVGLWQAYVTRFVTADGRVIDNVNGGISHSESQGYGMLLAVAANDRAVFERIWGFTDRTLFIRDDGLAAWKFEPVPVRTNLADAGGVTPVGRVADMNNATDGDILIAWALAEAGAAGFGEGHTARAAAITAALRGTVYQLAPFGLQIMPGKQGFSAAERDGRPVINPSYWVFPAFQRLALLTPDSMWMELEQSGRAHIEASNSFAAGLLPDWVALDPAAGAAGRGVAAGFDDAFGYNNIRIPLYLAMTGSSSRRILRAGFEHWFRIDGPLHTVGVSDRVLRDPLRDPGYEAIRALDACATRNVPLPPAVTASLDVNYYPATLQLLALAAARRSYPRCL
jgi:endoglucanase